MLIARALEKDNFKLSPRRVDNAVDLEAALDARPWDLILSDYSMPGFNGAEALALCRQKAFDAPFIIVSGRIGEEVAVEMMKAGASDYVMKDDLPRLAPAVTRELRAARDRKVRRQAQLAMAHLASIVETCDDAIISQTLGGTILSWNSGAERMFGFSAEDMVGEPIENLVPRDQRGATRISAMSFKADGKWNALKPSACGETAPRSMFPSRFHPSKTLMETFKARPWCCATSPSANARKTNAHASSKN